MERPLSGGCDRHLQNHDSPLAADLSQCSHTGRSLTAARKPDGCKLSIDPLFVEKVRDIIGPYLNPPDRAMVLCVDEKTQIQALDRTQPRLPMGLGCVEGVTHDGIRHGTTSPDRAIGTRSFWVSI